MRGRWVSRFRGKPLLFFLALPGVGVLAHAWHVHKLEVVGVRHFDAAEVHKVLEDALGKPPVLASASALREKLLRVPWVEDAQVAVGLNGTVRCLIRERTPVAILTDHEPWQLVDGNGTLLGPAEGITSLPQLAGFAHDAEERARVLETLPVVASTWGKPVVRCQRLGASAVAVTFLQDPTTIILDPQQPESLANARQVVEAWQRADLGKLARVDVRVPGKVFVQPAEEQ